MDLTRFWNIDAASYDPNTGDWSFDATSLDDGAQWSDAVNGAGGSNPALVTSPAAGTYATGATVSVTGTSTPCGDPGTTPGTWRIIPQGAAVPFLTPDFTSQVC